MSTPLTINDVLALLMNASRLSSLLQHKSVPQMAVDTPVVTRLPTDPQDRQEVYYLADDVTTWHLRFRKPGNGRFPWDVLSAPSLHEKVITRESTASAAYVALATAVSVQVPFAGDYRIEHGATIEANSSALTHGLQSVQLGATAASNDNSVGYVTSTALHRAQVSTQFDATLAAGAVVALRYINTTGNTSWFAHRYLTVTPLRVGLA